MCVCSYNINRWICFISHFLLKTSSSSAIDYIDSSIRIVNNALSNLVKINLEILHKFIINSVHRRTDSEIALYWVHADYSQSSSLIESRKFKKYHPASLGLMCDSSIIKPLQACSRDLGTVSHRIKMLLSSR